jgi:hypothetical protein
MGELANQQMARMNDMILLRHKGQRTKLGAHWVCAGSLAISNKKLLYNQSPPLGEGATNKANSFSRSIPLWLLKWSYSKMDTAALTPNPVYHIHFDVSSYQERRP